MAKGVIYGPIVTAYRSATLLGFRNTALMIEGLGEQARPLNYADTTVNARKAGNAVVTKIGCIRSAMEKERSEYEKEPREWFGWTRMNVFLAETLKGAAVAGLLTYVACSAASMFHFTQANSFSWPMFFVNGAAGLARAIWLTIGSSRENLIRNINRSLSELESMAKGDE